MTADHDAATVSAPAQPLVETRDLLVGYGPDAPVCAPITLSVAPGEVLAVVGANGTGKSTLLRTVTGILPALAGTVRVLGRAVDERTSAQRAALAVDLGDEAFFPALTVREHLELVCVGHRVPDPRGVVEVLLEDLGLESRADALPEALSSGQRRRLLLASVLARPRSLLILDEPEQRLDAGMRDRLTDLLREEAAAGGAVLVVTHDPALVRGAATGGIVLAEADQDAAARVTADEAADAIESL